MKQSARNQIGLILLNLYHLLLVLYWIARLLPVHWGAWFELMDTFALYWAFPLFVTLPLALWWRGKQTATNALLLLIMAVIGFAPPLRGGAGISGDSLRIITFNTLGTNPQLEDDMRYLLTWDADVIVLQEIVSEGYDSRLAPLYRYYPYEAFIPGSVRVYSRYPMLTAEIITIEEPTNAFAGRWAVRTVLNVESRAVVVYGVHLSMPLNSGAGFYNATHRNQQISNLVERIRIEQNPVILAGDFNLSHSSAAYRNLQSGGLRDAHWQAGRGYGMTFPAVWALPPLLRIDYVWYSKGLNALTAQRGARLGSDHLPFIVDFEFKR